MAKILGTLPPEPKPTLLGSLTARLSETARLKAEYAGGAGLRRLTPLLQALPESVTAVLRPKLGFMQIDCCVVGAGKVLAINALHWKGKITPAEGEAWVGAPGAVDLGRPDRRAHVFADRVAFSGLARGFTVEPVVIGTLEPVELLAPDPLAPFIPWGGASQFLAATFPAGVESFDATELFAVLTR